MSIKLFVYFIGNVILKKMNIMLNIVNVYFIIDSYIILIYLIIKYLFPILFVNQLAYRSWCKYYYIILLTVIYGSHQPLIC